MQIDTVNVILDESSNPLAAKALPSALEELTERALLAQGHALVVLRQASARGFIRLPTLESQVVKAQDKAKQFARAFLDGVMPGTITVISDAGDKASLLTALYEVMANDLPRIDTDARVRSDMLQVCGSLAEQFGESQRRASDFAAKAARQAEAMEELAKQLDEEVGKIVSKLDGSDGLISQLNGEIDSVRKEVGKHIDGIVAYGQEVGEGLKGLVTGALTSVTVATGQAAEERKANAAKKPNTKDAAPAKTKASDADDETVAKPSRFSKEEVAGAEEKAQFHIEGIGRSMNNAKESCASVAALAACNDRMAKLYAQIARFNASLMISRSLADQMNAYAKALTALSAAANAYATTWDEIVKGVGQYSQLIQSPAEGAANMGVAQATFATAVRLGWKQLPPVVVSARKVFATASGLFPSSADLISVD